MRLLSLLLPLVSLAAAEDPREIVRRCIESDRRHMDLYKNYTYIERSEQRQYDGSGKLKKSDIRTYDVTLQEGSPYRRLIERDGKPVSPEEAQQERDKLQANIEMRRKETPEQRARRIADFERRLQKQREPAREVPDAFNFKLAGEEIVEGRAVWVIDGTPKPGYKPKSKSARFFPGIRGRLWIDKADYQWVKGEIESFETISIGAFLLRLAKGSRITVEQTFVNNEVWLPKHVTIDANARILFVKSLHAVGDIRYSNYRKFQVDSRIVSTEEKK